MIKVQWIVTVIVLLGLPHASEASDLNRLVTALLGETPMIDDLRELTDEIGGRPTGSKANGQSIEWGIRKFTEAGLQTQKAAFLMPGLWLERSCSGQVMGDVQFDVRLASMPFSTPTSRSGLEAALVDVGSGTAEEFTRIGKAAQGAFVLVETELLLDIDGLFREYTDAAQIESRAFAAGVAGVVYMSSRADGLLYRHNASKGFDNVHPLLVMERSNARRAVRLLRAGKHLTLHTTIDIAQGGSYESHNVIAEIRGSERPSEIVLIGAHLDSWGLGTGANDNGCNVVMMIDIARQMQRLGVRPKRTIRFALWNGEEQGFYGSWGYTVEHATELSQHVMTCSVDIGSGRITGFFTNGRPALVDLVARALKPVEGLGPFEQVDVPIVGTDNFDFMMHGVPNLVANHDPYNYGPNYHSASDTFDKVDVRQLRLNAAIVAALALGFANMDDDEVLRQQTRDEIQSLVDDTSLGAEMRTFGLMLGWQDGARGRQ